MTMVKRIAELTADNAALLQKIDKLELRINGDARNLAYADAEIGRLRARVAELELQVELLTPKAYEYKIEGSNITTAASYDDIYEWTCSRCGSRIPSTYTHCPCAYDGEGVA